MRISKWLTGLAFVAALGFSSAAFADTSGPDAFRANKCQECHSVKVAGIAQTGTPEGDKRPPDLSKAGEKRDKKWIAKYLIKKVDIDGVKHEKRFSGTKEELKAIATWLGTLK